MTVSLVLLLLWEVRLEYYYCIGTTKSMEWQEKSVYTFFSALIKPQSHYMGNRLMVLSSVWNIKLLNITDLE